MEAVVRSVSEKKVKGMDYICLALTAFGGFCFGVVYLLLNRNIKWTYVVLCGTSFQVVFNVIWW